MSEVRIISGMRKNFKLRVPKTLEVRPTAVKAKKALFDSLGEMKDLNVIDICAGVGGLGLEAASRGAKNVLFLEISKVHSHYINRNCARSRFRNVQIETCDATTYMHYDEFDADIIFADPPYCDSAKIFAKLVENPSFMKSLGKAKLVWELPSTMEDFMPFGEIELFSQGTLRIFNHVKFLILSI